MAGATWEREVRKTLGETGRKEITLLELAGSAKNSLIEDYRKPEAWTVARAIDMFLDLAKERKCEEAFYPLRAARGEPECFDDGYVSAIDRMLAKCAADGLSQEYMIRAIVHYCGYAAAEKHIGLKPGHYFSDSIVRMYNDWVKLRPERKNIQGSKQGFEYEYRSSEDRRSTKRAIASYWDLLSRHTKLNAHGTPLIKSAWSVFTISWESVEAACGFHPDKGEDRYVLIEASSLINSVHADLPRMICPGPEWRLFDLLFMAAKLK